MDPIDQIDPIDDTQDSFTSAPQGPRQTTADLARAMHATGAALRALMLAALAVLLASTARLWSAGSSRRRTMWSRAQRHGRRERALPRLVMLALVCMLCLGMGALALSHRESGGQNASLTPPHTALVTGMHSGGNGATTATSTTTTSTTTTLANPNGGTNGTTSTTGNTSNGVFQPNTAGSGGTPSVVTTTDTPASAATNTDPTATDTPVTPTATATATVTPVPPTPTATPISNAGWQNTWTFQADHSVSDMVTYNDAKSLWRISWSCTAQAHPWTITLDTPTWQPVITCEAGNTAGVLNCPGDPGVDCGLSGPFGMDVNVASGENNTGAWVLTFQIYNPN